MKNKKKKLNLPDKIIDQLVEDIMPLILKLYYYDKLRCPICLRNVPNKKWFTKQGCIWCDVTYDHKNVKKTKGSF